MKQLLYFFIGFSFSLFFGYVSYAAECPGMEDYESRGDYQSAYQQFSDSGATDIRFYGFYQSSSEARAAITDSAPYNVQGGSVSGVSGLRYEAKHGWGRYYFAFFSEDGICPDPLTSPDDSDGDGIPDINDPDSPDYDPYHNNSDFDGDGIVNGSDPDVDGDGIPDVNDPEIWVPDDGTGTGDETSSNDYSGILSSIDSNTQSIKNSAISIDSKISSIDSSLNTANSTLTQIQSDTNQIKTGIDSSNTKLSGIDTSVNSIETNTNLTNQNLGYIKTALGLSNNHLSDISDEIGDISGPNITLATPTAGEIGQSVSDSLIDSSQTIDTTITDNLSDLDESEILTSIQTKYSDRYDLFITTLKGSDLFSLPFGIFTGPSGSGSSVQTVNIGKWGSSSEQTATIDYSDYDNVWGILRSVFLLVTSFSCFKILVLKKV